VPTGRRSRRAGCCGGSPVAGLAQLSPGHPLVEQLLAATIEIAIRGLRKRAAALSLEPGHEHELEGEILVGHHSYGRVKLIFNAHFRA
jgi:hypothetical protein